MAATMLCCLAVVLVVYRKTDSSERIVVSPRTQSGRPDSADPHLAIPSLHASSLAPSSLTELLALTPAGEQASS